MGDGTRFSREISGPRACSRLSDSGEDVKVKGTRKVGGWEKGKRRVFTLSQFNYLGAWKSGYFLSGLLDRNMLIVIWCERSLHPSKVR